MLLGIDIGTSACKVAVFENNGHIITQSTHSYPVYYPKPGWAEQDPEDWWCAVCAGIHDVIRLVDTGQIEGIGIAGQGWSAIPVDRNGKCLFRTPIWMDTRSKDICHDIRNIIGSDRIFSLAGNDFLPSYTTPKMLWFKSKYPDIYNNTYKFLQSHSYIGMKLTGVMSQDICSAYGLHFFNIRKLCYDEQLAVDLGLSTDMVPELSACHDIIGEVSVEAASVTGLKAGTPVVAGGLDAACGTLGAGVYKAGQTQEQGGQAGGMSICVDRALSHKKLILSTHVIPGLWLLQGGTVGGGGCIKWFRQELGSGKDFSELDEEADSIASGADGVIFLPYMAGERSPIWNPDAKGVFYGLDFSKTRGHMVRAVLEGVAFSLEHNLLTAAEAGVYTDVLLSVGGASNSRVWTQIKADVTGKAIKVPFSDSSTALGAAILAGIGTGVYNSFEQAIQKTVNITKVYLPDEKNHKIYQACMKKYLNLYESLSKQFSTSLEL